jgi:hypothetical protein
MNVTFPFWGNLRHELSMDLRILVLMSTLTACNRILHLSMSSGHSDQGVM